MTLRLTHALGAGAAVLGLLVAAPALAGVAQGPDPGGQPPPGSKVVKDSDFVPGKQPAPGSKAKKTTDFVPGTQPANPDPDLTGPPTTIRDTSDKGQKNLP